MTLTSSVPPATGKLAASVSVLPTNCWRLRSVHQLPACQTESGAATGLRFLASEYRLRQTLEGAFG